MQGVTNADRKKELQTLLDQVKNHPEHDHTEARQRIAVLRKVLEAKDTASA